MNMTAERIKNIREMLDIVGKENPFSWAIHHTDNDTRVIDNREKDIAILSKSLINTAYFIMFAPGYVKELLDHAEAQQQQINRLTQELEIRRAEETNPELAGKLARVLELIPAGDTHAARNRYGLEAVQIIGQVIRRLLTPANVSRDIDDIPF